MNSKNHSMRSWNVYKSSRLIVALSVDEMSEWCNSFALVPKANDDIWLCLNPFWLKKVLLRPVKRGSTLNDILLKLSGIKYLTPIDASSGYNNLKLDMQSSYLTTFSCPFSGYRCIWLPFGMAPAGDMFQRKIDKLFNRIPNVFSIADDILIAGFDELGRGHDATLDKVLRICRQANMKL